MVRTAPRPGLWARSSARLIAGVAAAVLLSLSLAGPAAADTIECTPMGDPACRALEPTVECTWDNGDGTKTILWGYRNPSAHTLNITVGNKNSMSPGAAGQGQPETFAPGTHPNAFVTDVAAGAKPSWRLGNNDVSVTSSTAVCMTKPVSLLGDVTALAVFLLLLAVALPAAVRPRHVIARVRSADARPDQGSADR